MATGISFAGNDLQQGWLITNTINHAGLPVKRAQFYALSHANASRIPFVDYPTKPITITGTIVGANIADLDAKLDTFNSYFVAQDGNLDIDFNSSTRRYIATATNISVDRPGGLAWANFTVTFTCTRPFGRDITQTTALNVTGRTSATYADTYTFLGTAPYQLPIITVTFTAVSGATNQFVAIGNNNNGQMITVTRTWTNGDVLQIDTTKNIVTVNGVMVDFTGAFPVFPPGSQIIGYSDGFASRTFNYDVSYTTGWL